jgi:imidazolonepropionase-like amidohydrolase
MTGAPARFTLITASRLLDGAGGAPLEPAALLVEGDRIVSLERPPDVQVADGARVERRDYPGGTILPGLVDAHTHLVAPGDGTLGDESPPGWIAPGVRRE